MCCLAILAQCFSAIYALTFCYHMLNMQNRKKSLATLTLASDSGHKPSLFASRCSMHSLVPYPAAKQRGWWVMSENGLWVVWGFDAAAD